MEITSSLRSDDEVELERRVHIGDAYEASQLYLGHMGRLRQSELHPEAEGVGIRGAIVLIKAGEYALATPLAMKVVESISARMKSFDANSYLSLTTLIQAYDDSSSMTTKAQIEAARKQKLIVSKAVCKLVSFQDVTTNKQAKELHAVRAHDLSLNGQFAEASKHFALADKPEEYALLIQRWSASGYASEKDLFGVRAVLHVLSIGSSTAPAALKLHVELSQLKVLGGSQPLEHFLSLVFELINHLNTFTIGKHGAAKVYATLLTSYQSALRSRDPRMELLAQKVGQRHFGWKPPPSPMQGFMNMFNN